MGVKKGGISGHRQPSRRDSPNMPSSLPFYSLIADHLLYYRQICSNWQRSLRRGLTRKTRSAGRADGSSEASPTQQFLTQCRT